MNFRLFALLVCFSWACGSSGDDPVDPSGDVMITDGGSGGDGGPGGDAGAADAELTGPPGDRDDDGIQDDADNCPTAANHGQSDGDGDGVGDACDNCPEAANPDQADQNSNNIGDACDVSDRDGDGIPDIEDDCPDIADPDQLDGDNDGIGDVCDNCPDDPNFSQTDTDGDGIGDACEVVDDNDGDGVLDTDDNCPEFANPNQVDTDDDGIGDGCDNCPNDPNFSQADANNDGVGDACAAADRDEDGIADGDDNCPDTANAGQADPDEDGGGSACDNCPATSNPLQEDTDNDGTGDACEDAPPLPDRDEDGVPDAQDNCPDRTNAGQTDSDRDDVGNACDNCPNDRNPDQADSDNDGQGDACDNPVGNEPAAEPSIVIVAEPNVDVPIVLHVVDPSGYFGSRRYDTGFRGVIAGPGRRSPRRFEAYALLRGRYEIAVRYVGTDEGVQPPVEVSVRIECNGEVIRTAAVTLTTASASDEHDRASMSFLGALRMPTCDFRAYDQPREPPEFQCESGDCPCRAHGCRPGVCSTDECQDLVCDRLTGECLNPCAGVNCPQGQTCGQYTGECQGPSNSCGACDQPDQCVDDATCIRNIVGERFCGMNCNSDHECEDHEKCSNGYCQPFAGTCEDRCADVACQPGLQCSPLYGVCQPERCGYNHDCPDNHYCSDGECLPAGMGDSPLGLQCAETADCEPGHVCNELFTLCARLCNTDRDCPQNFLCQYDFLGRVDICIPQF